MMFKKFIHVFGKIVCMDCGGTIEENDEDYDSSGLCSKCEERRCKNGGNA